MLLYEEHFLFGVNAFDLLGYNNAGIAKQTNKPRFFFPVFLCRYSIYCETNTYYMRRIVLFALVAVAGFFLCYNLSNKHFFQKSTKNFIEAEGADEGDEEDGIRLAQEQDFERTKDLALGYVPQSRLIAASEALVEKKRVMRSNPMFRTEALTWTERGPNSDATGPTNGNTRANSGVTSGRIRAVWIDLADASNKTVWIGGIDGGMWKTTDITASPATWTPVNDFLSNLAISGICQDPSNNNVMYFGTGEKAYNLDAVKGGGIWKSNDHGTTWTLLPSTTGFNNISKIVCDASGSIYVATVGTSLSFPNGSGVRRSSDGGVSWTNITPSGLSTNVTEMKISSTGRLHVVCGYSPYQSTPDPAPGYRFTDNPATVTSATWTTATTSFGTPAYNCELGISGNTMYALNSNSSFQTTPIYKSTDGGANWAATTTSPPASSGTNDLSSGQAWYNIAVAVDPLNGNNVIAGGLNCYRSTDGGATWTQSSTWVGTSGQYVHADQQYAVWNGNQVLVASDGGIFYSSDGGVTFRDRNVGLRLKQFYSCAVHPTSINYFLAGAQDNGVHQLNSAGLGASVEVTGGDGALVHIDQDQPQYQFGSYVYNQYRRSTDGGNTWSSVNYSSSIGSFINPTDYDDYNNKLYACAASGQYLRWDNPQTGNTFTTVSVGAFNGGKISHLTVSPYTGNRVYFGTDGGSIVRVDNADQNTPTGTNITGNSMTAGASVSCVAAGTDDNNLLATFSNYGVGHIWVSTTGGGASGWTNISGNLPDIPVRWAMFYPYDNTKAIIATEAGVFETTSINGASTVWVQSPSFPIVRTDMLQYRPSDGVILAATHGRGLWSAQIPVNNTYVKFSATALNRPESTSGTVTVGCTGYTDYTVYLTTNRAPSGTATATINPAGGTAVQGVDFDFTTNGSFTTPSNIITLMNGSITPQPITIRIYDNSNNEALSSRNFTLTYTLSGTTDAIPTPGAQTFMFTINNDDLPPLASATASATLGTYQYNLVSSGTGNPFNATLQSNRCQMLYKATELTAAGFIAGNITSVGFYMQKFSTRAYTNLQIKMGTTSASYLVNPGVTVATTTAYKTLASYTTIAGLNTFMLDTPFSWDGTSNVVVEVCYDNGTADAANFSDVLQGYSDGGTATQGNMFWQNGINCGSNFTSVTNYTSGIKPRIYIAAAVAGTQVEATLSASKTNTLAGNYDVYYYSTTGKIMARIQNASGFNYGCTQITLDRAGTGASPFWSTNAANYLASKTFRVVPTTNNLGGQYQITLYYTAAEKAGWEAATGQNWNNIKLVKVKSQISNYTASTPAPDGANAVEIVTPLLGTLGSNYTVTGTFSSGFSGFGVGIPGNNPLPITLLNFSGRLDKNTALLNWSTSSEQNSKSFEIEKSTDGNNYNTIGAVAAAGNSSTQKEYSLTDTKLSKLNYYRLRMNDLDGRNKLSQVVLLQYNSAGQNVWVVNNPFTNYLDVRMAKDAAKVKLQLIGATGNVVEEKAFANTSGFIHWSLSNKVSSGTYILRSVVDGTLFTSKLMKQ